MIRPFLLLFGLLIALAPLPGMARIVAQGESWQQGGARDLAEIRRSGELRVLVNQSRNSSGVVDGKPIGVEYARLVDFVGFLNDGQPDARKIALIPRAKDQLLAALQRGEGDLAAPGELIAGQGEAGLVTSVPIVSRVPLVVVSRKGSRRFQHLDQLAGHEVALPAGSAAGRAIDQVNRGLEQRGRPPIRVEWVDPTLAVEDVLEMVQTGIYPMTAVEQPIAQRWAKVMPKLRVDRQLALADQGDLVWLSRQGASTLQASVDRFLSGYSAPAGQDAALAKAYRPLYQMHDPLASADRRRLEKLRPLLQRYAQQHEIDWLNLAALALKESALDPSAKGSGGAVGLMQITPSAAQSVGVGNIQRLENNVQAGTRYLARLRRDYFASARLSERERMAFVLAAYNLGPQRVQELRDEARRLGLNPNQWFFQVERVALDQVGMGVVSYVNSVNKYYLAYDRGRDSLEQPRARLSSRD